MLYYYVLPTIDPKPVEPVSFFLLSSCIAAEKHIKIYLGSAAAATHKCDKFVL
jgi:hypothetical protein